LVPLQPLLAFAADSSVLSAPKSTESQVGDAIGKAIVILSRFMCTWTIGERWYTSLLAQASTVAAVSSAPDHARRQLGEDRSDGIYRQFTQDFNPPPRPAPTVPVADPTPPPPPAQEAAAPVFEDHNWAEMSLPMGMSWSGMESNQQEPFVFQGFDLNQLESDLSAFAGLDFAFGGGLDGGMQG
jgi:hypothetical protein